MQASQLSSEEKRAALQHLMHLKKKRCGKIKGHGCADGCQWRPHTEKEDASAPTTAIESVMMSCGVHTLEGMDVATADIPGAFMHADMDETVHVQLEDTMAELFAKLDPKLCRKCAVIERGKLAL